MFMTVRQLLLAPASNLVYKFLYRKRLIKHFARIMPTHLTHVTMTSAMDYFNGPVNSSCAFNHENPRKFLKVFLL